MENRLINGTLSFYCDKVRSCIAMMPLQLFFIFPTLDCVLQRFPLIVCKKVSDISIVLKLLINFGFSLFLILKDLIIRFDRFTISFSCIAF